MYIHKRIYIYPEIIQWDLIFKMWATRLITKTTAFFKKSIYKRKISQYKHRQHLQTENNWRFWDYLTKEPSMWKIENAWYHTEQTDHIKEKVSVYGSVQNSLNWHITDLQPILHPQVKWKSIDCCNTCFFLAK